MDALPVKAEVEANQACLDLWIRNERQKLGEDHPTFQEYLAWARERGYQ